MSIRRMATYGFLLFMSAASTSYAAEGQKGAPDTPSATACTSLRTHMEQLDCRLAELGQTKDQILARLKNASTRDERRLADRNLKQNRQETVSVYGKQAGILEKVAKDVTSSCLKARVHGDIAATRYGQYSGFWYKDKAAKPYQAAFRLAEKKRVQSLARCALDENEPSGDRIAARQALINAPDYISASGKYAAIIVDLDTGQVLHDEDAGKRIWPASLVKIMTLFLIFDDLEDRDPLKKISADDRIIMTRDANAVPRSHLRMKTGEELTVATSIEALVVLSGNNVAEAAAMRGGTRDAFVARMNTKAKMLGMHGTRFTNPSGLHDDGRKKSDEGQYTTAGDMAILVTAIRREHPDLFRQYFSMTSMQWKGRTLPGHNKLLKKYADGKGGDITLEGSKTGFTEPSGCHVAVVARSKDRHIALVLAGLRNAPERDELAEILLKQSLENAPPDLGGTPDQDRKTWKRIETAYAQLTGQHNRLAQANSGLQVR
ncbi:MAG: serine hydrolase [Pseudomonadota bacterium]|nr:serine hydrolase [Pseudomonadota bacterium]